MLVFTTTYIVEQLIQAALSTVAVLVYRNCSTMANQPETVKVLCREKPPVASKFSEIIFLSIVLSISATQLLRFLQGRLKGVVY